jgi:ribose transport system ATP-binding protein
VSGLTKPAALLEIHGLSKTFGRSKALDAVDLVVAPGEVHGLLGENGSGKSTLIKVLSGFHSPDAGASVAVAGRPLSLPVQPGDFRAHGISFVHQDLGLVPDLTVTENLHAADILGGGRRLVSWRAEARRASTLFSEFGIDIDPNQTVSRLTPTQRALLAIVRAVAAVRDYQTDTEVRRPALLVLDEPTVFLPREGADLLFALIRTLVSDGSTGVLFVSHDLDEVLAHTDVVTVLRDGRVRGTAPTGDLSREQLIELIVGRHLDLVTAVPSEASHTQREVVVTDLSGGAVTGLNLQVHRGEILGLTGLAGSGYDDILPLLFGASRARGGTIEISGRTQKLSRWNPAAAMDAGVAFIPADRASDGSVAELSVADNVMLPVLGKFFGMLGLRRRAIAQRCTQLAEEYDVRPRNVALSYGSLSGGNQQKALLAKWLHMGPRLVLLQEPTQGVDVGARAHIFALLAAAADSGAAIACASSDYEQLAVICDRVVILANGKIVDTLTGADVVKERIVDRVLSIPVPVSSREEVA